MIVGKDKISTLEIVNKDFKAYWYSAVGYSTTKFSLGQGNQSFNIVPKGMGAIVDTRMTNLINQISNVLFSLRKTNL